MKAWRGPFNNARVAADSIPFAHPHARYVARPMRALGNGLRVNEPTESRHHPHFLRYLTARFRNIDSVMVTMRVLFHMPVDLSALVTVESRSLEVRHLAFNSISFGSPHVRPTWALSTCGGPNEISFNTHTLFLS